MVPPTLTDEDIIAMWDCTEPLTNRVIVFARAIEAVTLANVEARYRRTLDHKKAVEPKTDPEGDYEHGG